ncbi:MAG: signal peptidase II, partial [Acidimicrobiales bacterium]
MGAPSEATVVGLPRPAGLAVPAIVAGVVILLDQASKAWAEARLDVGPCTAETCIDLVGPLRFHLSYNTGMSFGVGQGSGLGWLIGVVACVVAVWLLQLARRSGTRVAVQLAVVAGGAIGNVIDRVARAEDGFLTGGVVDFIDAQFFPIFNVADMAVVGGVISLMVAPWIFGDEGLPFAETDSPEESARREGSAPAEDSAPVE